MPSLPAPPQGKREETSPVRQAQVEAKGAHVSWDHVETYRYTCDKCEAVAIVYSDYGSPFLPFGWTEQWVAHEDIVYFGRSGRTYHTCGNCAVLAAEEGRT